MKVFYIYTALRTTGGVDRVLTVKANYLARKGYDVAIITDSQIELEPVFSLDKRVRLIDLEIDFGKQYEHNITVRALLYFKLMQRYKKKLSNLLYRERPDFVISTMGRDMDFLNDIKDGSIKLGESHIAKRFCRNFHLMEAKGGLHKIVARYWRKKHERAAGKLEGLILLTTRDAENWKKYVKRTFVIPNPITVDNQIISNCSNKRVISVGRFSEQKGFEYLIDTWNIVSKKHPDWKLDIFGEGMLKDELQSRINSLKLQRSICINNPTKDIVKEYAESSIYVMSSRFEGFGLVLVEAMSCGVPCVSFDCPDGPKDIITNCEDGYLVRYLDINELAEKIICLIENEDLRKRMGQKALENVQRYNLDGIMKKWIELFEGLKN